MEANGGVKKNIVYVQENGTHKERGRKENILAQTQKPLKVDAMKIGEKVFKFKRISHKLKTIHLNQQSRM